MKLLLDNLPVSLQDQRDKLTKCLEAMNQDVPLTAVYLFGSHARGEALPGSDVDLCLVAEGTTKQLKTAQKFRKAIWDIWLCPALTLIPITPRCLKEKKKYPGPFFGHDFEGRTAPCHVKLVNALTEAYFSDRYPGFDRDDPDWPTLRQQIDEVGKLLDKVKARITQKR